MRRWRKPTLRFHLCFALSERGPFVKRYKRTQKIWTPAKPPACGRSPAMLGPGGRFRTRFAQTGETASSAWPCASRRLPGL